MNYRFLIVRVAFIITACSTAFSQEKKDEIAWRIVSIGETEIPSDWEENSFTLQKDGTVKGPLTESAEFHWLQAKGVSTQGNDGGNFKVTTTTSATTSNCHHKRDKDRVSVSFSYSWSSSMSFPGGEAKTKNTIRTILNFPDKLVLDPPKKLTGKIERLFTNEGTFSGGGAKNMEQKGEQNLTGQLELRLKNEEPTPESFEALQAVKSLPIVIEQVPSDESE